MSCMGLGLMGVGKGGGPCRQVDQHSGFWGLVRAQVHCGVKQEQKIKEGTTGEACLGAWT